MRKLIIELLDKVICQSVLDKPDLQNAKTKFKFKIKQNISKFFIFSHDNLIYKIQNVEKTHLTNKYFIFYRL